MATLIVGIFAVILVVQPPAFAYVCILSDDRGQMVVVSQKHFVLHPPFNLHLLRTTKTRLRCQSPVGTVAHSTVRPALWLSTRGRGDRCTRAGIRKHFEYWLSMTPRFRAYYRHDFAFRHWTVCGEARMAGLSRKIRNSTGRRVLDLLCRTWNGHSSRSADVCATFQSLNLVHVLSWKGLALRSQAGFRQSFRRVKRGAHRKYENVANRRM